MKIFNWVHRRFHHKYEEQDATKAAELMTENGKDKLALLDNELPLDSTVFDGWEEGILAIGTFGFDPALLKEFEHEEEEEEEDKDEEAYVVCDRTRNEQVSTDHVEEYDNEEEEEEEDMEFPLVLKACKRGFFHDNNNDKKGDDYYLPQCDEISQTNNDHEDAGVEDTPDQLMIMRSQKKAGERITLADLFLADSQKTSCSSLLINNKQLAADEDDDDRVIRAKVDNNNPAESINTHADHSNNNDDDDDRVTLISNNYKKLTKDHAPHPIKKINRMVRKMLKKKIHPDFENQKEAARTKPKRL